LGQSADLVLVAPATARLLAALATGYSHDLLTNTLLATRAPVVVCPAMHTEMWEHPAVRDNVDTLRSRGVVVVEPESGRLAGGDVGAGRLADPESIVSAVERVLGPGARDLAGLRVLVTAGGTREPIDPVRFLGNRSSGRQGHALADEAAARGAEVTIITTTSLPVRPGVHVVSVATADEMHRAVGEHASSSDVVVMAAAVADFTPVSPASTKLKKADGVPLVELRPTVDILAELGRTRHEGQTVVGFAAETDDVEQHARSKLESKGADLLVVNDVSAAGVGFEHETNEVRILDRSGDVRHVPLTTKSKVAAAVLDAVLEVRTSGRLGQVG
jgi:phosphopantothenoylcysteine decarboxylase/phosphopantothenate--cysteine ligase